MATKKQVSKKSTPRDGSKPVAQSLETGIPASSSTFAAISKLNSKPKRGNPDAIAPYKFKPGISGNPSGRPKRKILTDAYKDALELPAKVLMSAEAIAALGLDEDCTMAEAIARSQVLQSVADVKSAGHIADRTEGKPSQKIEISRGEFDGRSDSEIQFYAEHGYFPETNGG